MSTKLLTEEVNQAMNLGMGLPPLEETPHVGLLIRRVLQEPDGGLLMEALGLEEAWGEDDTEVRDVGGQEPEGGDEVGE